LRPSSDDDIALDDFGKIRELLGQPDLATLPEELLDPP
jgi:hypothetical protein